MIAMHLCRRQFDQQPTATTQIIVAELKLAAQALGAKLSEKSEQDIPNMIHTAHFLVKTISSQLSFAFRDHSKSTTFIVPPPRLLP